MFPHPITQKGKLPECPVGNCNIVSDQRFKLVGINTWVCPNGHTFYVSNVNPSEDKTVSDTTNILPKVKNATSKRIP